MRILLIRRLQRLLLIVSFVLLVGIAYLAARSVGFLLPRQVDRLIFITPTVTPTPERDTVALISGHVGYDSGAICGDVNAPTLREVEIVARIAELVRERLENAGMEVLLLEEYDARLTNLDAELMLSLHADSCILASGYKAAYPINSAIPTTEKRLIACIDTHYAARTGLAFHNSITEDMTRYHALSKSSAHHAYGDPGNGFSGRRRLPPDARAGTGCRRHQRKHLLFSAWRGCRPLSHVP